MTNYLRFIGEAEEHSYQYASKAKARTMARIESQRTGIAHTHYLTTTWRDLTERLCWAIIPVQTAKSALTSR